MATLTMGLIGEITAGASPEFLYDFITPDFSRQPKRPNNPFDGEGNWPSSIAIFQQRRVYASTDGKPSTLFFSHIGFFDDFSLTEFPDGSFELELDSKYFDRISHMVPMHVGLLLFSERDVYLVTSAGNSGITLNTAVSRNELESGARRDVQPINVLKNVVFMSNLDGSPRALAPTPQSDSQLITQDLALLNQHLFDKSDVIAWTYAGRNDRIIWAAREDGVLLSCTYAPEHQVSAWCKHSTRGRFLDVQAVYEQDADTVYMVVERGQHSFIEYFPAASKCAELGTAVDAAVEAPKILVRRELEIADYVDGVKQGAPDAAAADSIFADYTGIGAFVPGDTPNLQDHVGGFICTDGGVYKILEAEGEVVPPTDSFVNGVTYQQQDSNTAFLLFTFSTPYVEGTHALEFMITNPSDEAVESADTATGWFNFPSKMIITSAGATDGAVQFLIRPDNWDVTEFTFDVVIGDFTDTVTINNPLGG